MSFKKGKKANKRAESNPEEEEYHKLRTQFDQLDKNNDGKIDVAEVQEVLAAAGITYDFQDIRDDFKIKKR